MKEHIFDMEADNLLPGLTKMHVISWQQTMDNCPKSSADPEAIDTVFDCDLLIGHFITGYDLPAIEKLFGKEVPDNVLIVDTLALAWYLDQGRAKYGLESYGTQFGVPKPPIKDWKNLTYEDYEFRCERDVEINTRLWKRLKAKLIALYGQGEDGGLAPGAIRLIRYLTFKMKCAFVTSQHRIRLDYDAAVALRDKLSKAYDEKYIELAKAMPKHTIFKTVIKPKNLYRKDGSLSVAGERWFGHLEKAKMPKTTEGAIKVISGYEQGNPGSHVQIKEWLFGLGWQPKTYKFDRDSAGNEKKIPQVRKDGELCDSVKDLIEKDSAIEQLEGMTVIAHRLSVVKGFIECAEQDPDGSWWIKSEVEGLTNTFRFKHRKPVVNLPGVDKAYGADLRGLMIAPSEAHELIGSDMVSLNFGGL